MSEPIPKIKVINISQDLDEYLECVEDLMGSSTVTDDAVLYERVSEQSKYYEPHYRPPNYITFVCLLRKKIVATASILYEYKLRYTQPKAYIEDVAVHRNYRGKGYGKKIVEHCIEHTKQRDCYKVVLTCNDDLMDFYKSMGFKQDVNFMVLD